MWELINLRKELKKTQVQDCGKNLRKDAEKRFRKELTNYAEPAADRKCDH